MGKRLEILYIDLSIGMEDVVEEYLYYRTQFNLIALFSTASIEDGENFLRMIESHGLKDYTYIRINPDASNYCKKNVVPISFFKFIIIFIYYYFL